jgi:hypothetical protein
MRMALRMASYPRVVYPGGVSHHDGAARYPYRRAVLPVDRLEDGSMVGWQREQYDIRWTRRSA